MNSFLIYQLIFFILIYIKSGYNYPSGAPATTCTSMTPGHGVSSQQCSSKYIIQSDKLQYYTNDTVRITINGSTSTDTFRGILLIAKTETTEQIIGTWSPVSTNITTVSCGGIANTGITHTSRIDKLSIEALWYPSSVISDKNTIIKATIVTAYSQIYVNCFSITLVPRNINITTTNTSTTSLSSTVVATTTAQHTSDVGVHIQWTYANGITTVKMDITNLKTSQWAALGLSLDDTMGEDHVFVCKRLADDTVSFARLINPGGHSYPVSPESELTNPGGTLNTTLERLENDVTSCEFTLSNFVNSKRQRRAISILSQSQAYRPLIAIGNLDSSNAMIRHTSRTPLSQSVQLNREETIIYNTDLTDSEKPGLMKAHGIIMLFIWILLVPTGILIARFFKPSWPNRKLCGEKIWFSLHRTIMTSVAILTIIAFIFILSYKKGGWVSKNNQREYAHSIIGIIVICFAIIQPFIALFRCKPEANYRFIFNYVHGFIGFSALILSIVAIYLAIFFSQFNFESNKIWGILVAWTCWLPIIFIIFTFIKYYFRRNSVREENINSYDLTYQRGNVVVKTEPVETVYDAREDRIKLIFLLIHIIIALGIALALAILVGTT